MPMGSIENQGSSGSSPPAFFRLKLADEMSGHEFLDDHGDGGSTQPQMLGDLSPGGLGQVRSNRLENVRAIDEFEVVVLHMDE